MNDSTVCFLCIFRVSSPSKADSPFVVSLIQLDSFDPPSPPPLSPSPKNPDRFSSLPPELLDIIFDEAHSPDSPLLSPISSYLTPFWRSRRYREVRLKSYEQFASFANNVSPSTLKIVRSLAIVIAPFTPFVDSLNSFQESQPIEEEKDPQRTKNSTVIKLFRNLSSITRLAIIGSSRLARLVLHPSVATTCFPNLSELRFRSSFDGLADPLHPSHLMSLQFYENVHILEYGVYRKASSIRPSEKPMPESLAGVGTFLYLKISGPLSASLTSSSVLLILLRSVDKLVLDDTAPVSQLSGLVPMIHPELVQNLVLSAWNATNPETFSVPLLPPLLKFKSLKHLGLFGPLLPPTLTTYSRLHLLPLVSLQFGQGSNLSSDGIFSLISGPYKINTLKTLVIDDIEVRQGLGFNYPSPRFTDDFTREGFERLIEKGKTEGVQVIGGAIEALETLDEIEEEIEEDLQEYQAMAFFQSLISVTQADSEEDEGRGQRRDGRGRGRGRGSGRGRGRGTGRGRGQRQ